MSVDYPGAQDFVITDPAWVFTDALANIPSGDLTIVNHKTASGGYQTATQIAQFFQNDTAGHKSAHFVVGRDGSVLQVVKLKDGAGANCCLESGHNAYWDRLVAKYSNLNRCTISIEHEDWTTDNSQPMTRAQIDASNKLNLWLCQRFHIGIDQIHSHASMRPGDRARCPGPTFDFNQMFAFIQAGGNVTPPVSLMEQYLQDAWHSTAPLFGGTSPRYDTGIASGWRQEARAGHWHGVPLTGEIHTVDPRDGHSVLIIQVFKDTAWWDHTGQLSWH